MIDVEWFSDFNKCTTRMRINDTKSNLDISISRSLYFAGSLRLSQNINKSKSQNCKLKIENNGMMTFAFLIQSKRLWDHEMNVNFHFFISRQNYTFSVLSYVGFQTTMMAKTMMWVELHILN